MRKSFTEYGKLMESIATITDVKVVPSRYSDTYDWTVIMSNGTEYTGTYNPGDMYNRGPDNIEWDDDDLPSNYEEIEMAVRNTEVLDPILKRRGWEPHTRGTAGYFYHFKQGGYLLMAGEDEDELPSEFPVSVGIYNADGEFLDWQVVDTIEQLDRLVKQQ